MICERALQKEDEVQDVCTASPNVHMDLQKANIEEEEDIALELCELLHTLYIHSNQYL